MSLPGGEDLGGASDVPARRPEEAPEAQPEAAASAPREDVAASAGREEAAAGEEAAAPVADGADAGTVVAAVDLGSNSFHMVIARLVPPEPRILDRMRERVQLAAGLDAKGRLGDEAQARALDCLERFGQRLRDMPEAQVRAVGTNTLRRAKNARPFLHKAQEALGHPIEIVSGVEEARLIYLGVSHSLPDDADRRLVIDIGGGSTELILGERFEALREESLHMGCVSYTRRFFPGGELRRDHFRKAELAARLELQTIERRFRGLGWDSCVGASGTILAVKEIARLNGWSERGIARPALRKLRKALVSAGRVDAVSLDGLKSDRASVLPGGLAILTACFDSLGIDRMRASSGALREGLLYDLLGRFGHEDVRDRTIRRFEERYHVDLEQAARVERTALYLLDQLDGWKLSPRSMLRPLLVWAARLHEIGLAISYSSHHKHGAYLVTHSDMPGFSIDGKRALAALIRGHRRKLSRSLFPDLLGLGEERLLRLCLLLRLAVLLNRSRSPRPLPGFGIAARKRTIELTFPRGWLAEHPLTEADLEAERDLVEGVGYRLKVSEGSVAPARAI